MIHAPSLLKDLQRLLKTLENDLRTRLEEQAELDQRLKAEWQAAHAADRTGETYETWCEEAITQAAAHWLLACVFLRFIEDNGLIERPYLSGPGARLALARDCHESYFRAHPLHSDREYLLACFREVEALPGMGAIFDERHNPLFRVGISGDAAMALLGFWQKVNPDTGQLMLDFTDPEWSTRFLGDLYQDLSEPARKRYALLQTPVFVEEFILDRTLTPAIHEFGYREVRLIDPTCGSGHFLLGAFRRLFEVWARNEPARNARDTAQRALDGVYGVDLNPYAVAIARFRLLVAALEACGETRLKDAPGFKIHLATGDSLLHGPRTQRDMFDGATHYVGTGLAHAYATEDLDEVNRILSQQYHAVVGNPPYITVKDAALNAAYRARYSSCHMKYSLGVPFTQRFFDLALYPSPPAPLPRGERGEKAPSPLASERPSPFPSPLAGEGRGGGRGTGYVGMITANSFMKREFGKKLISEFLPTVDLTHVIDTAGAYIPGHGTPTVILFGRNRRPVSATVRTVMGIKGEPATPDDPAQGLVWRAIVTQVDQAGSESAFVSVADTPRGTFGKHPWSIGGGGAADLKKLIEDGKGKLSGSADSIGITSFTLEDEAFIQPVPVFLRYGLPRDSSREVVVGDAVRDWSVGELEWAIFPYDSEFLPYQPENELARFLWPYRTNLANNKMFGGETKVVSGLSWFEYGRLTASKLRTPLSITFAFVATHNHFVLDRGGKVFNRSAPVIKLPRGASEDEHLGLLGLLNSSVACFWMKQVFHNKGSTVDEKGARQRTDAFEDFYEYTGTGLGAFPLVTDRALALARALDGLAQELSALSPARLIGPALAGRGGLKPALQAARERAASIRRRMIALQEELDWRCYRLYGLLDELSPHPNPPPRGGREVSVGPSPLGGREREEMPEIDLGQRAFEIVMARKRTAGELMTTWFERHRSTPITELPAHWPDDYRRVVEQRIALIESDRFIGLIERPEYKRRWSSAPWEDQEQSALRGWLLDRLETDHYWPGASPPSQLAGERPPSSPSPLAGEGRVGGHPPRLTSVNRLADLARADPDFMQIAEVYAGRTDFDVAALVAQLVASESVPFLPVLRYTESGLRKHTQWERTWELQRQEDAIDAEVEQAFAMSPLPPHPNPPPRGGRENFVGRVSAQRVTRRSGTEMLGYSASRLTQPPGNAETATAIAAEQKRRKLAEVGDIPVPPKYQSKDFLKSDFWRLRGGLDVPKERFVSYPCCERGADPGLVVAWAGWDHLQQATALATYYLNMKEHEGWPRERLQPLLAGLLELVPWLKQWHNEYHAEHATRMGDYFASFVADEARGLGLTVPDLRAWVPLVPPARRGRRKSA